MVRMQGFVFALTLGTVAARTPFIGGCYAIQSAADCCAHTDGRTEAKFAGQDCVPSTAGNKFHSAWTCEPKCFVDGTKCDGEGEDDTAIMGVCAPPTTTVTPWDSSASSSSSSLDSLNSKSLESGCSSSFRKPWESSTSSTDSSAENSGSMESGSSGCYPSLPLWIFLCCPLIPLCLAPLCMPKPKPPKKRPVPKPEPKPEPVPEMVLTTTAVPVQQYVAQPMTTAYTTAVQQPIMTTAQPITTSYAEPIVQATPLLGTASYAQPTSYAQPAYGGYATGGYATAYPAGGVY